MLSRAPPPDARRAACIGYIPYGARFVESLASTTFRADAYGARIAPLHSRRRCAIMRAQECRQVYRKPPPRLFRYRDAMRFARDARKRGAVSKLSYGYIVNRLTSGKPFRIIPLYKIHYLLKGKDIPL